MGLCPALLHNDYLHQLMGEHIISSFSPRLDHSGQTFKFSRGGYGDTPIAVFNMRNMNDKTVGYLKVKHVFCGHSQNNNKTFFINTHAENWRKVLISINMQL